MNFLCEGVVRNREPHIHHSDPFSLSLTITSHMKSLYLLLTFLELFLNFVERNTFNTPHQRFPVGQMVEQSRIREY